MLDFWWTFGSYIAFWRAPRVPIGLVAPLKFKTLDSQPEKSNIVPVQEAFDELGKTDACILPLLSFVL